MFRRALNARAPTGKVNCLAAIKQVAHNNLAAHAPS